MEGVAFVINVKAGEEKAYRRRRDRIRPALAADVRQLWPLGEAAAHVAVRYVKVADDTGAVRREEDMAPIVQDESGAAFGPRHAFPEGPPDLFQWRVPGAGKAGLKAAGGSSHFARTGRFA